MDCIKPSFSHSIFTIDYLNIWSINLALGITMLLVVGIFDSQGIRYTIQKLEWKSTLSMKINSHL